MKYKIEKLLESLSRWLYRNPFKALLTVFLFVAMLVSQAPFLKIDTTSEALLHKDDPSLMEYNRFRDQFGRSELIIIAVESPEVFEPDFLKQLKTFHADLENVYRIFTKLQAWSISDVSTLKKISWLWKICLGIGLKTQSTFWN